jgi:hypothetical protein
MKAFIGIDSGQILPGPCAEKSYSSAEILTLLLPMFLMLIDIFGAWPEVIASPWRPKLYFYFFEILKFFA